MKPASVLLVFSFFVSGLFGQIGYIGKEALTNKAKLLDGEDSLYNSILKELRFPDEYLNTPIVSIILASFEIAPDSSIVRFFSLNDSDIYLTSEVNRVFSKLNFRFSPYQGDTSYFIIPVEFRNVVEEEYETDYYYMPEYINKPIVCFSTLPINSFAPDTIIIRQYEDLMKMQKYGKAMRELNLLIDRQPFKEIFYVKKIRLYTYMGKIDKAVIEQRKVDELFSYPE